MPSIVELLARRAGIAISHVTSPVDLFEDVLGDTTQLHKRVSIPCCNRTSPAGLVEANTLDPWNKSGKYALAWVYFCVILLVIATLKRLYSIWTDKLRTAFYKEETLQSGKGSSPGSDYEMSSLPSALPTSTSTRRFFPAKGELPKPPKSESSLSTIRPFNLTIAAFRYVFYRPLPLLRANKLKKRMRPVNLPNPGVFLLFIAALGVTIGYCFIPRPYFWQSFAYGSPPLAIRAGMLAVALMPWIIALSMKANILTLLTGISHERLNVLHRWLAYLCLILSIIHMVPFYIKPASDAQGYRIFESYFPRNGGYIYTTGICALVPLGLLCLQSLPVFRRKMYELFVALHVPLAMVYLGLLFWHCKNYLTSWHYLIATAAIWLLSYVARLFFLNWSNPWRKSWLIGEEAAVTLMPENAIKVTIPTQVRWKPGQYVYLRMPGVSMFENHPFTIASLCSEDFHSTYGEEYRDMVLVFRPFGGFTKKVFESAIEHGPWHTYRAFIDGPYGGMNRDLHSFDHVVLFAGGSGVTALISQLLDLIKRMREDKAVTKTVQVVWALKRPEVLEWFKEELRICREYAPPGTTQCQFYITAAKRQAKTGQLVSAQTPTRPISGFFHDKVNHAFQSIADNRHSTISNHRHSALIADEAAIDPKREKVLRDEEEDRIRPLPQAHLLPARANSRASNHSNRSTNATPPPVPPMPVSEKSATSHLSQKRPLAANLHLDISSAQRATTTPSQTYDPAHTLRRQASSPSIATTAANQRNFDFGFPSTPTEFQKNLMRFAFLPAAIKSRNSGWTTEYGRPDIRYMLREMERTWTGKRVAVYVCGPPSMRVDVQKGVAEMQSSVWRREGREEVWMHAENYAI
ncbi:ferric reductase like transmembrane component-domain-containing protein [Elsinoe ampelina]|uniref:ferric-chelate reductase (NADPH) n=1 Tax=Elsinoe ampelina TaxID=302913 RepID=A0A6A6GCW6_9PEZI|nr:ferric reductase like transmembrane component-domain-containing protein [Elsinoe ampelina]